MSLAGRALRSGAIVTFSSLAVRFVSFAGLLVLARELDPADFGVVALAVVVTSTASLFATVGMGAAIIASPADVRATAYHARVLNLALGGGLFLAVAVLAGPLGGWLGPEQLALVLLWSSPVLLLDTMAVVPEALLMKEVRFGRRAAAHVVAALTQTAVAVASALAGLGLWSLVAGHLAGAVVRLVLVVLLAPRVGSWRRQPWDRELAGSLVRFGGAAMGTTAIRHAYTNADTVFVGKVFGASALGFYTQAFTLTNLPVQSISQVTNAVLLPVYAKVRDEPVRLAAGYARSFRMVAFATVPTAVGIFILAPQAIVTLLGEQWRPSVVLLQILAGMALFRPLSGTTSPVFLAINRPGLNLRTAVVQGCILIPLALLLTPWGPEGVAAAVSAAFAAGFFYNMWQLACRTPVPIDMLGLARSVVPTVLASATMAGAVLLLRAQLVRFDVAPETPIALAAMVALGVATYLGAILLLDRGLVSELVQTSRDRGRPKQVAHR